MKPYPVALQLLFVSELCQAVFILSVVVVGRRSVGLEAGHG